MLKIFWSCIPLFLFVCVNSNYAFELKPQQKVIYEVYFKALGDSKYKVRERSEKLLKTALLADLKKNMTRLKLDSIDVDFRVLTIDPYIDFFKNFEKEFKDPEIRVRFNALWAEVEATVAQFKIEGLYFRAEGTLWRLVDFDPTSPFLQSEFFNETVEESSELYLSDVFIKSLLSKEKEEEGLILLDEREALPLFKKEEIIIFSGHEFFPDRTTIMRITPSIFELIVALSEYDKSLEEKQCLYFLVLRNRLDTHFHINTP